MWDGEKRFALRTCHGTTLAADAQDGTLSHEAGVPVLLLRTGPRSGALARADGGSLRVGEDAPARLLACALSEEGPRCAILLGDGLLLTSLPGGGIALDRAAIGGWELLEAVPTTIGEAAFAPLAAHAAVGIDAPSMPADVVAVRAAALDAVALRDLMPALARRADYGRIFPALRLALSGGQRRSVWDSRTHLAGGMAAFGWEIGDHTYGAPTIVDGEYGTLSIGRYCSIAADVRIVLANHLTETATTYPFAALRRHWPSAPEGSGDHGGRGVVIGHSVWIGTGATILPGARIGDGAIIGAEAVCAGVVPPYAVAVGNPARVTRRRFDEATVARLLALRWWDWPDETVDRFIPLLLSEDIAGFLRAAEATAAVARAA